MSHLPIQSRSRPIKLTVRKNKLIGFGIVAAVMFFSFAWQASCVGWFPFDQAHGLRNLKVWIFDVGQGDAIFIETPEGEQILLDAGEDDSILTKLGQVMLPWDRTIDAVVITHPHADHEGGLPEVLRRYDVGTIYETGVLGYSDLQETVHKLADGQGIEIVLVQEGILPPPHATYRGGLGWGKNGTEIKIFAPDSSLQNKKPANLNNASIVLLLTYGQTSILLTGDAPIDEEDEIFDDVFEPIDVLKAAHHGSVTSTSGSFLEVVQPRYAIISVGVENDYGHPHPATLERLRSRGIEVFRTDLDGDILITSDGGEPVVESRPLPF